MREGGLILGPFPSREYGAAHRTAEPGDRLVLYADGIVEATDASGEFFGIERLKQFIEDHEQLPAGMFADALLQKLDAFSGRAAGRPQEDDLTVVVVDILLPTGVS